MSRADYSMPKDAPHPGTMKARADALERVEKRMLDALLGHDGAQNLTVSDVNFFARYAKQLAADAVIAIEAKP